MINRDWLIQLIDSPKMLDIIFVFLALIKQNQISFNKTLFK